MNKIKDYCNYLLNVNQGIDSRAVSGKIKVCAKILLLIADITVVLSFLLSIYLLFTVGFTMFLSYTIYEFFALLFAWILHIILFGFAIIVQNNEEQIELRKLQIVNLKKIDEEKTVEEVKEELAEDVLPTQEE